MDKPAKVYYSPAPRFIGIQLDVASKWMEDKYGMNCLEISQDGDGYKYTEHHQDIFNSIYSDIEYILEYNKVYKKYSQCPQK